MHLNAPLLEEGLVINWPHVLLKEADEFVLRRDWTTSHLVMKQLVDR